MCLVTSDFILNYYVTFKNLRMLNIIHDPIKVAFKHLKVLLELVT